MADSEILPYLPDFLDSVDGDMCLSNLDELAQSLLREAAEELDTEHRQISAEVSFLSLYSEGRFISDPSP